SYHKSGPSVLTRDDLVAEFKITDDQKAQYQKVQEEARDRMREMFSRGGGSSSEDRDRMRAEIEAKYLAVLTPAQQQQWKDKIGPAPKELDGGSRPSFVNPGVAPGGTPAAQPRYNRTEKPVEGPVVMSFEKDFKAASTAPKASDDGFSFTFNGAPWDDVLELFAKKAGLTLDIHDTPPGTFTYFDSKTYTPTQALDVINRYLADRGYILIRRDNSLVCYNLENPISPNLIPNVTVQDLPNHGEHELMRLVLPLTVGNVEQVAKDIDAVKGPQGSVTAMVSTNTIVVTDLGTNLRRIAEMVRDIVPPSDNGLVFHSYHLNFIAAEDAESVIRTQLGVTQTVTNVSSGGSDRGRSFGGFPPFGGFDRGRDSGGDRGSSSSSSRTTATPTPGATVQADTRLNNLFVTATPAQQKVVEEVLRVLDVDDGSGKRFIGTGSNKPYLEVYTLKTADAREVAKSLGSIIPGVVVNEDGQNNSIHIMATTKQHEQVRQHIALMDGRGGLQEVAVIPLAKMDPTQAMSSLRAVFVRDGSSAPTIEPDTYGRQLIVRATAEQLQQIRDVLKGLGEDGTGRRPSQTGNLRAFNLQGRDADAIMKMTQQQLGPGTSSRIRIVTPQDRGAVNGIRVPSQRSQPEPTSTERDEPIQPPVRRTSTPGGRASYEHRPGSNVARMMAALAAEESTSLTSAATEDDSAQDNAGGKSQESSKEPSITVTVIGDQLVLQSNDTAALDQLESVLQQSLEYLPPSNKPTIFILQSADPVETANTLVAMFPDLTLNASATSNSSGTMSNLFSGVSNFGSSLWDASGMSSMSNNRFQVIPNTRLNALFVYGPPHKVAEIEQMIEILDATDWPESGRSRKPRMIELKYADVNEVYTIVKDVYSDYLESESQRQAQNPLAALAGGGRGGSREVTPPRMTLGVDHNSSKIIVSASDDLFNQVLSLVETLDKAALESQRTVRVVQIKNADAATLQNA
ncbi:MAG TPA: secretin N-terminal domain-containing protein, partial [Caulifigura sp.]|nr:secretin N-terminal domain-containing protein [Caulifigura sp.]